MFLLDTVSGSPSKFQTNSQDATIKVLYDLASITGGLIIRANPSELNNVQFTDNVSMIVVEQVLRTPYLMEAGNWMTGREGKILFVNMFRKELF